MYIYADIWKAGVFLAKTIAIVNQKGGVRKTTTSVNLSAALTEAESVSCCVTSTLKPTPLPAWAWIRPSPGASMTY